jgi:hypothetical protein
MDKQDLLAKIEKNEYSTMEELNAALIEVYGNGKKAEKARKSAAGYMRQEKQNPAKNMTAYVVQFERFLNPSESADYDSED